MTFIPSKYQNDIFNVVDKEDCNILVNAVAGSGKTTTLIKCFDILPKDKKILCLAFNKHIAKELKKKVPNNVNVSTIHGIGWQALMNYYGVSGDKIDSFKINNIIRKYSNNWKFKDFKEKKDYEFNMKQIVDLCRMNLRIKREQIKSFSDFYGYKFNDVDVNRTFQIIMDDINDNETFDYVDMIFKPCVNKKISNRIPKYYNVFIDEVQDTNLAQQTIFKNCIRKGGRFFAFGDPKQCIYAFMGSNTKSFERIGKTPNTKTLPLSISYRCSKNVVKKAKKYVSQIEASENAVEGMVSKHGDVLKDPKDGDFVLARANEPLIKLLFYYISKDIKCTFNGKDLARELKKEVRDYIKKNYTVNKTISDLNARLELFRVELLNKGVPKPEETTAYKEMKDKIDVLNVFAEKSENLEEIVEIINQYFSEKKKGVILSTVHKAKGLEADNVFIIRPDMLPSNKCNNAWEFEVERNLTYVAITRAKKNLYYDIYYDMDKAQTLKINKTL